MPNNKKNEENTTQEFRRGPPRKAKTMDGVQLTDVVQANNHPVACRGCEICKRLKIEVQPVQMRDAPDHDEESDDELENFADAPTLDYYDPNDMNPEFNDDQDNKDGLFDEIIAALEAKPELIASELVQTEINAPTLHPEEDVPDNKDNVLDGVIAAPETKPELGELGETESNPPTLSPEEDVPEQKPSAAGLSTGVGSTGPQASKPEVSKRVFHFESAGLPVKYRHAPYQASKNRLLVSERPLPRGMATLHLFPIGSCPPSLRSRTASLLTPMNRSAASPLAVASSNTDSNWETWSEIRVIGWLETFLTLSENRPFFANVVSHGITGKILFNICHSSRPIECFKTEQLGEDAAELVLQNFKTLVQAESDKLVKLKYP